MHTENFGAFLFLQHISGIVALLADLVACSVIDPMAELKSTRNWQ